MTNIDIKLGQMIDIGEREIVAGDISGDDLVDVRDLSMIIDHYMAITALGIGATQEEIDAYNQKAIYDFNGDNKVDKLDRNIIKKNYRKKFEPVEFASAEGVTVTETITGTRSLMTMSSRAVNSSVMMGRGATNKFITPLDGEYTITSEFGEREHPVTGEVKKHTGIDLCGVHHAEVLAVADGEVTFAGSQSGYGNCVEIRHVVNGETVYSFYAHLSRIDVEVGDTIVQGNVIGLEGGDPATDPNPGTSTGHHLHFEIRTRSGSNEFAVNPENYIKL